MSNRSEKERLFGGNLAMVDEMISWLHSWDPGIGANYGRKDNGGRVIGLTWVGRSRGFNIVTFRQREDRLRRLRVGLKLKRSLSDQFEPELRQAGLVDVKYSEAEQGYLLIPLTPIDFSSHKPRLQELPRTTYEQAI